MTQNTRFSRRTPRSPATQLQRDARSLRRALAQRRRLRLTIRAVWIALGIFAVGLLARVFGLTGPWWMLLGPAAAAGLILMLQGWIANPSLPRLLDDYDQHFGTNEMLASGLEVARRSDHNGEPLGQIEERLVDQSGRAIQAIRRRVHASALVPWREMEMLLAASLLVVGLFIVGMRNGNPAAAALAIPSLPTPAPIEQPQTPTEQPVAATPPPADAPATPEDQAAAAAIADALSDNSATSGAGSSLEQGQTGQAADQLRDAAGQSESMSEQERSDLADDLRSAADQLEQSQPERAQELREQADQIESDPASAEQGLNDLADTVEQLGGNGEEVAQGEGEQGEQGQDGAGGEGEQGQDGQSGEQGGGGQGAGDGLGGESRGTQTNPEQAQGDITPLPPDPEANGDLTSATGPQGPNVQLEAGGTRSTDDAAQSVGGGADAPLSGDADPLRIPPEYRDVVENYFSPTP